MILSIFVWTFESIITIIFLGVCFLFIILCVIKHLFDVTFKKNCYKCKHCYLYSVPSFGNGATHKCDIKDKNRTIRKNIDNNYAFCKEYEKR